MNKFDMGERSDKGWRFPYWSTTCSTWLWYSTVERQFSLLRRSTLSPVRPAEEKKCERTTVL
jgi:hypothetical protein